MNDRELKKLNRLELLELLIKAAQENEDLKAQAEEYTSSTEMLNDSLNDAKKHTDTLQAQLTEVSRGRNEAEQQLEELSIRLEAANEKAARLSEVEAELAQVRAELEEAKNAPQTQQIELEEAGSIAEASLRLNGIFEAAQKAADEYVENVRALNERKGIEEAQRIAAAKAEADRILSDAQAQCESMLQDTEFQCTSRLNETKAQCEALTRETNEACEAAKTQASQETEAYWQQLSSKMTEFCQSHREISQMLSLYQQKMTE